MPYNRPYDSCDYDYANTQPVVGLTGCNIWLRWVPWLLLSTPLVGAPMEEASTPAANTPPTLLSTMPSCWLDMNLREVRNTGLSGTAGDHHGESRDTSDSRGMTKPSVEQTLPLWMEQPVKA